MTAAVAEGDIVLEKYRVERVLGQGGMGVVVAATHVDLEQKVALKFLLPTALEHAELVERFAREAKAAAKIQSQHVVRVIDTGRMPSGAPFMVMEYLDGEDLAAILKRSGALEPNVAADYLLQACEAIGEAHAAGIVHRDLKPSNLFLAKQRDRRSIVKVLDFGISKLEEPDTAPLTRTTTALGSPHYMSPEQLISSKHVDARSDIWSLGVVLYELVAGSRPFGGETMPEVVGQVLNNTPERLSSLRPGVSLELELVVARCLASDVKNRYPSVAELAAALRPFATDATTAAASVERIARVLGHASIPPAAPPVAASPGVVVMIKGPEVGEDDAGDEVPVTVRPAKAAKSTKVTTAVTAAAPPSDGTPAPQPVETSDESGPELAHAATTPSNELSAAVRAARGIAERPPSRRGLLAAAGVALCLVAFVGVRAGMSRSGADPGADGMAGAPRSAAPSNSAAPSPVASAPPSGDVATASAQSSDVADASAPSSDVTDASAASSAVAKTQPPPSARPVPAVTSTSRPTPRPSVTARATAPAASAGQPPPRDSLNMDIK